MTKYQVVLLAVLASVLTTMLIVPLVTKSKELPKVVELVQVVEVEKPHLNHAQIIWLARLMYCESGLKSNAVNPKDLDNTPSYGLLQFKPSTFHAAVKKYGLSTTTSYMDAETQVAIAEQWILNGVDLTNQFPACVRQLGHPPSTDIPSEV